MCYKITALRDIEVEAIEPVPTPESLIDKNSKHPRIPFVSLGRRRFTLKADESKKGVFGLLSVASEDKRPSDLHIPHPTEVGVPLRVGDAILIEKI
jgi:hypothetical protein